MTNKQRQTQLDKMKYIASEQAKRDLSGEMPYCDYCAFCTNIGTCSASQTERESGCFCAKAFNKGAKNAKKRNA